jgi:hypothetical protein
LKKNFKNPDYENFNNFIQNIDFDALKKIESIEIEKYSTRLESEDDSSQPQNEDIIIIKPKRQTSQKENKQKKKKRKINYEAWERFM